MPRASAFLLAVPLLMVVDTVFAQSETQDRSAFLVHDKGYALLNAAGEEIERLDSKVNAAGALSPDGELVAFARPRTLILQFRGHPEEYATVPLVWGTSGSTLDVIWLSDSRRILIYEQGWDEGVRKSAHRIYDLVENQVSDLRLPQGYRVSDWTADGKRLLATAKSEDDDLRIVLFNRDGTGDLDYITSNDETAYQARLSPDGTRILCAVGPKQPQDNPRRMRLCVIDLATKQRRIIDEPSEAHDYRWSPDGTRVLCLIGYLQQQDKTRRPRLAVIDLATKKQTLIDELGETYGYCWSPDGSRIAYTWQRSLDKPAEVDVRETFLMTCNADGSNRKAVTSRKYQVPENSSGRDGTTIFFTVLDWK